MRCPQCGRDNDKVVETRVCKGGVAIRRRRQCEECGFRFTTREMVLSGDITVVKRDGRREEFDPEKLRRGIGHACWKRSVSAETVDALVEKISAAVLQLQAHQREVPSMIIGEMVMDALRTIDEVAYVRFASVYRRFKDIDQFISEVQNLNERQADESG